MSIANDVAVHKSMIRKGGVSTSPQSGCGKDASGPAGGDLTGTYPNPEIKPGTIVDADINAAANIQQSKISGLPATLAGKQSTSQRGVANGYASLDSSGKVPSIQLPAGTGGAGAGAVYDVISDFGAVGDGVTDDQIAIQTALDTVPIGSTLLFPAGHVFNHSGALQVKAADSILTGGGTLEATNQVQSAIIVMGVNGVVIRDLRLENNVSTERQLDWAANGISAVDSVGISISDIYVSNMAGVGIYIDNTSHYQVTNCTIEDTWADSFHQTHGSNNGIVRDVTSRRSGDDGIAVVSYEQEGRAPCHDISIERCHVYDQRGGRAFTVVGGENITYRHCTADQSWGASIYVACEPSYTTYGVQDVLFENITISRANVGDPNPRHGSILIFNERDNFAIRDVTLRDISISETTVSATREFGVFNLAATSIIERIQFERVSITDHLYPLLIQGEVKETAINTIDWILDGISDDDRITWGSDNKSTIITSYVPPKLEDGLLGNYYIDGTQSILYGPKGNGDYGEEEGFAEGWQYNSGLLGVESWGNRFTLLRDGRINGISMQRDKTSAQTSREMRLYHDSTLLASGNTVEGGAGTEGWMPVMFDTPVEVEKGWVISVVYDKTDGGVQWQGTPQSLTTVNASLIGAFKGAHGGFPSTPDPGFTNMVDVFFQPFQEIWPIAINNSSGGSGVLDDSISTTLSTLWRPAYLANTYGTGVIDGSATYLYRIHLPIDIDQIAFEVTTAGATTVNIIAFADTPTGPGSKIGELGPISTGTTGIKTNSTILPAGWYWIGLQNLSATPVTVRTFSGTSPHDIGADSPPVGGIIGSSWKYTGTGTTPPTTLPAVNSRGQASPAIYLRAA